MMDYLKPFMCIFSECSGWLKMLHQRTTNRVFAAYIHISWCNLFSTAFNSDSSQRCATGQAAIEEVRALVAARAIDHTQ